MKTELLERLQNDLPKMGDGPDYRTWCNVLGSDLREAIETITNMRQHITLYEGTLESRDRNVETLSAENRRLQEQITELERLVVRRENQITIEQGMKLSLKEQLTQRDELLRLAQENIRAFTDHEGKMPEDTGEFRDLAKTLSDTDKHFEGPK
jgi:chromosome segregation ATPase